MAIFPSLVTSPFALSNIGRDETTDWMVDIHISLYIANYSSSIGRGSTIRPTCIHHQPISEAFDGMAWQMTVRHIAELATQYEQGTERLRGGTMARECIFICMCRYCSKTTHYANETTISKSSKKAPFRMLSNRRVKKTQVIRSPCL